MTHITPPDPTSEDEPEPRRVKVFLTVAGKDYAMHGQIDAECRFSSHGRSGEKMLTIDHENGMRLRNPYTAQVSCVDGGGETHPPITWQHGITFTGGGIVVDPDLPVPADASEARHGASKVVVTPAMFMTRKEVEDAVKSDVGEGEDPNAPEEMWRAVRWVAPSPPSTPPPPVAPSPTVPPSSTAARSPPPPTYSPSPVASKTPVSIGISAAVAFLVIGSGF